MQAIPWPRALRVRVQVVSPRVSGHLARLQIDECWEELVIWSPGNVSRLGSLLPAFESIRQHLSDQKVQFYLSSQEKWEKQQAWWKQGTRSLQSAPVLRGRDRGRLSPGFQGLPEMFKAFLPQVSPVLQELRHFLTSPEKWVADNNLFHKLLLNIDQGQALFQLQGMITHESVQKINFEHLLCARPSDKWNNERTTALQWRC